MDASDIIIAVEVFELLRKENTLSLGLNRSSYFSLNIRKNMKGFYQV